MPVATSGPRLLVLHRGTVVLATIYAGLITGYAFTYAIAVMPGLAATDDGVFVAAFAQIDRAIDANLMFWIGVFLGCLAVLIAASVTAWRLRLRPITRWLALACVLYLAAVILTAAVIDPLESNFIAVYDGGTSDPAAARAALNADLWALLNYVRLVLTGAVFIILVFVLMLTGQAEVSSDQDD